MWELIPRSRDLVFLWLASLAMKNYGGLEPPEASGDPPAVAGFRQRRINARLCVAIKKVFRKSEGYDVGVDPAFAGNRRFVKVGTRPRRLDPYVSGHFTKKKNLNEVEVFGGS